MKSYLRKLKIYALFFSSVVAGIVFLMICGGVMYYFAKAAYLPPEPVLETLAAFMMFAAKILLPVYLLITFVSLLWKSSSIRTNLIRTG